MYIPFSLDNEIASSKSLASSPSIVTICTPVKSSLPALSFAGTGITESKDPRYIIENGVCKLADHSALAGSIATNDALVRNMVKAGVPLTDALRMASETPANIMGVSDRKGSLEKGKDADIVILDDDLQIRAVWQMGNLVEETNTL